MIQADTFKTLQCVEQALKQPISDECMCSMTLKDRHLCAGVAPPGHSGGRGECNPVPGQ